MSDATMMLYHPRGPRVTLPVYGIAMDGTVDYVGMLKSVSDALDAGWLVDAPGLEAGENRDQCGWVMRTTQNKNGRQTPIIHLYRPDDTWPTVKTYLNRDEDIDAFEHASGIKFDSIPDWPADSHIQRGTGKDQYILKAPKPFGFVYKDNPKYDEKETDLAKKKANGPARKFVRWVDQMPAGDESPQRPSQEQTRQAPVKPLSGKPELEGYWKRWQSFFSGNHTLEEFNQFVREQLPLCPLDAKPKLWEDIQSYESTWTFDRNLKEFVRIPEGESPF